MGIKQNISDLLRVSDIKDAIIEIVEAKVELKKIEFQERAEKTLSELTYNLVVGVLILICMIFLLILIGFLINMWLGEPWGFIIILSLCLVLLIVVKLKKETITKEIQKNIAKEIDSF